MQVQIFPQMSILIARQKMLVDVSLTVASQSVSSYIIKPDQFIHPNSTNSGKSRLLTPLLSLLFHRIFQILLRFTLFLKLLLEDHLHLIRFYQNPIQNQTKLQTLLHQQFLSKQFLVLLSKFLCSQQF